MQEIRFHLVLSADEFLRYYRAQAQTVVVTADDGRTIHLPANALRPFVGHDGVRGRFVMRIDARHKLVDIRRV